MSQYPFPIYPNAFILKFLCNPTISIVRSPGIYLVNQMHQFNVGVFLFTGAVISTNRLACFSMGLPCRPVPALHVFLRRWWIFADFFEPVDLYSQLTDLPCQFFFFNLVLFAHFLCLTGPPGKEAGKIINGLCFPAIQTRWVYVK